MSVARVATGAEVKERVTRMTFIGYLLRIGACLCLLAGSPAAAAPERASPEPESLYLIIRTNRLDLPVADARLTTRVGEKLPLFQQNDQFFIVLLSAGQQGCRLCAFPLETRDQNRSAWISAERMVIFAYPSHSVDGTLSLTRGEVFPLVRADSQSYEIVAERFGRQISLLIPKDSGGIEVVTSVPSRAAPGATLIPIDRTYRGLSAVTNADGAVSLLFDPAAAAYLDQLVVSGPRASVQLRNPSVSLTTGDSLPLFQQNENYFITLVNTEYDGLRLCAFPLTQPKGRVGWVTPEKRLVLADTASSCEGIIYLRQGEALPIIGQNDTEYEVLIERSGRWAPLRIPRNSPNIKVVRARTAAPKPAAPPPPRRTIVLKNEPAINQIVLPIPTESPEPPPPRLAEPAPGVQRTAGFPPMAAIVKTNEPPVVTIAPTPEAPPAFAAGGSSASGAPSVSSKTMASLKQFLAAIWMVLAGLVILLVLVIAFAAISRRKTKRRAAEPQQPPAPPLPEPPPGSDLIAPPVPTTSSDFSGSLSSMSIGSVSQFLNSDKESGILSVKDTNQMEVGTVLFVKGEIYDAKSATHRGVPAVYDIMRAKEGFFTFTRGDHSSDERTILEGTITMLLEAHRIMDEEGPKAPPDAPKEKPRLRRRPTSRH